MAKEWTEIFNELQESLRQIELNGRVRYIVEGDLALDEEGLATYARERAAELSRQKPPMAEDPPDRLVADIDKQGRAVRWARGKLLSYAVLRTSFASTADYELVVRAMGAAAADWQEVCDVRFQHLTKLDDSDGAGALFTVKATELPEGVIALAFFPGWQAADRLVQLGAPFFDPDLGYDTTGVLRHELGHVLGFRHEHIRSGAPPVCQGEPAWNTVNITDYDPKSVMHYFCGGIGSKTMQLTEKDRLGARWLYGPPDGAVHFKE